MARSGKARSNKAVTAEERRDRLLDNLAKMGALTELSFQTVYGQHAFTILRDVLQEAPCPENGRFNKKGKSKAIFFTLKEGMSLPSPEEFSRAFLQKYTYTANSLLAASYGRIDELAANIRLHRYSFSTPPGTREILRMAHAATYGVKPPVPPTSLDKVSLFRPPSTLPINTLSRERDVIASDLSTVADEIEHHIATVKRKRGEFPGEDHALAVVTHAVQTAATLRSLNIPI